MPVANFEAQLLQELKENAEAHFKRITEKYEPGDVKVVALTEFGPMSRMILDYVSREAIDIVIMGSHGASGAREFFVGSNAEKMVRNSPVPVLVTKDFYKGPIKHIVFPNDLETENQVDLVLKVKALQDFFKAHLHLVWINTPLNFTSDPITKARLEAFAKRFMLKDYTIIGRLDPSRHFETPVEGHRRPGLRDKPAAVLRTLEAEAEARQRLIRLAEHRIVCARVQPDVPVLVLARAAHVQFQRLPRVESGGDLLRKRCRVSCHPEGFACEETGRLMVAVTVPRVPLKPRDDDHRAIGSNDANHVPKHVLAAPLLERLVEALGESIVGDAREMLVDAVVAIGDEQFLGADEAERVEELRANRVVARFAARQGQEGHARAQAATEHRQHPAVLIVWVSGGVHGARGRLQLAQLLPDAGSAPVRRRPLLAAVDGDDRQ